MVHASPLYQGRLSTAPVRCCNALAIHCTHRPSAARTGRAGYPLHACAAVMHRPSSARVRCCNAQAIHCTHALLECSCRAVSARFMQVLV